YTVELRVPDDCAFDGKPLREFATADVEVIVVSVVRQEGKRALKPGADFVLRKGDQLTVEIDPDALPKLLARTGFELSDQAAGAEQMVGGEVELYEAVVMPRGRLVGKTVMQAELRSTLGLNVVGVARGGRRLRRPLREIRFEPGDVLLIQNRAPKEGDGFHQAGLLPLAPRTLVVNSTRRLVLGLSIFAGAVAMLAMGWMSAAVAFTLAGLLMVLTRLLRLEDAYRAIDMPIVVLLGAMIPVGRAFETTGGATQLAELLVSTASVLPAWSVVGLLLVLTMVLSDVMNNAATAVIMAPIAVHIAEALEASSDPFLMAVAIGASCAFLTPIGHQSNTLVMGPGGYRFSDYWRLGLPLELLIIVLGLPLLLWIWPLSG
ncbi:MAG: SLC13 family permease, partial [Acidobacteriota bacterium]